MAKKYELNYDWHQIGPVKWTEEATVTLQVDLHSYDNGDALWAAIDEWWSSLEREEDEAYEGGAHFPRPVRLNERHVTMWVVSHGEDSFDSIAHYAETIREVAEGSDSDVVAVWTELPHR